MVQTRELDLKPKFPEWDPELHYMIAVFTYLKSIFYMKDFPPHDNVANPTALDLYVHVVKALNLASCLIYWCVASRFRHNPEQYVADVEASVEESLEHVYNNEQGSTIRFTKHSPAHDHLRQELFAQLDDQVVRDRVIWFT